MKSAGAAKCQAFQPEDLEAKERFACSYRCQRATREGGAGASFAGGGAAHGITGLRSPKHGERASHGEVEEIWSGMPSTEAFRENRLSPTRGGEEGEAGKEGGSSHICKLFLEGNPVPLKLTL